MALLKIERQMTFEELFNIKIFLLKMVELEETEIYTLKVRIIAFFKSFFVYVDCIFLNLRTFYLMNAKNIFSISFIAHRFFIHG